MDGSTHSPGALDAAATTGSSRTGSGSTSSTGSDSWEWSRSASAGGSSEGSGEAEPGPVASEAGDADWSQTFSHGCSAPESRATTKGFPRHSSANLGPAADAPARTQRPTDASGIPVAMSTAASTTAARSTAAPALPSPACNGRPTAAPRYPPPFRSACESENDGRVLGQLGQPAHAEQSEHGGDDQAPSVDPRVSPDCVGIIVAMVRRVPIEEQRAPGGERNQREEHAGHTGHHGQSGVGGVTDRSELLAPEREGEQHTHGDQGDRAEIPGLNPPERRWGGLGSTVLLPLRVPVARRGPRPRGARRAASGRARRCAAAGLGHHSGAEITG